MSDKILIFRRGSIGDAVISIPALNAVRAQYPTAALRLLSNTPISEKAGSVESVFDGTGTFESVISAPPGGGGTAGLLRTRTAIKEWAPDQLIFLSEPSRYIQLCREFLFFKSCGIPTISYMPFGRSLRQYKATGAGRWESESSRLLRAVGPDPKTTADWSFEFPEACRTESDRILSDWQSGTKFIAFSIGAKLPDKDWGDSNWSSVLDRLTAQYPQVGIVCVGAPDEFARCERLVESWRGAKLNLCGRTEPLVSALVMEKANLYLGHDSGPMHLAALTDTRCVAIFSARAKPGVWFPQGDGHHIFYPWSLEPKVPNKTGFRTAGNSILDIQPDTVFDAVTAMLDKDSPNAENA